VGCLNADVNPLGPVHVYVAPATVGVDKLIVPPTQYGPVLLAVGVAGNGLTTTVVVPAALVHPLTVIVTLYTPPIAAVADAIVGFCNADVNPSGPVHAYVAPATVGVAKLIVPPSQYGP